MKTASLTVIDVGDDCDIPDFTTSSIKVSSKLNSEQEHYQSWGSRPSVIGNMNYIHLLFKTDFILA